MSMTTLARRAALAAALSAIAALASGCAGLQTLSAATVRTDLYDLTPKSTFAADLPRVRSQIVVDEPTAGSYINTDKVAVKVGDYKVEYFPVARWVDRAPKMVQKLLVESLENTGVVDAVGQEAIGLSADYTLIIDLREFQAHTVRDPGQPMEINVRLNIKIVQEPDGLIIASESFGRTETAKTEAMLDVVAAFDETLGKSMRDAVEWSVRKIAAHPAPRRYLPG